MKRGKDTKQLSLGEKKGFFQSDGFSNAMASVLAIMVGLLFGLVALFIIRPERALQGFGLILSGSFNGGAKGIGEVLYFATPIILTGLSVGFAFKTGLFNIGASGQYVVGAFTAIYIGIKWTWLPEPWHWIVAILVAAIAGGVWAMVPGFFKAYLNVNEVISCIMMNYIGMLLVNMLFENGEGLYNTLKAQNMDVASSAVLPKLGMDKIFMTQKGSYVDASSVNIGIFIAIAIAIVIYMLLNKTTFGYELKACGHNRFASRYAGINEKRSIILSMVIAGSMAAIAGALMYLAPAEGRHLKPIEELASEGFNGIFIALLGLSNPIGIVFSGLFVSYIQYGGEYLQTIKIAKEMISIIIAIIIYFSAFSLVFRNFAKKLFGGGRKKPKKPGDVDHPGDSGKGILPPDVAEPHAKEAT